MVAKRIMDLLFAATALVVLLPLLLILALLVRLDSRGPALFRQRRVGLHGREFRILKLRTMHPRDDAGPSFEPGDSSRVTRVGIWLRRLKLDELPQLLNVLVGDMSLIGPRPEVRQWVDAYPRQWALVHTVKPGITDPASILYRDEEALLAAADDPERMYREVILPHKLGIYAQYVRNRSFAGDLLILIHTALAVFGLAGRRQGEIEVVDADGTLAAGCGAAKKAR